MKETPDSRGKTQIRLTSSRYPVCITVTGHVVSIMIEEVGSWCPEDLPDIEVTKFEGPGT